ncbi:MAG TPA: amino acid ABC transporter permease [Actinomycetota bacterium]|nr:amino acid ABC transporter permease [Actinomycetota bacterium]
MATVGARATRIRDALERQSLLVPYRVKLALVWAAIFTLLGLAFLSYGFDTEFMARWAGFIVKGAGLTVVISVAAIALAVSLALLGALGRLSKLAIFNGPASFYVSFVRGTPLIVQIYFVYLALPQIAIDAPPWLYQLLILDVVPAGIIALGINYGAYMTEIFRAGITSVGHGQVEAAHALGMTTTQTMRRIVLPQAVRVIIPPTGNEFIAMLKDSALVGILGTPELFFRATKVGRQDFRIMETLVVAAAIYWLLTSVFSFFQSRLERRLATAYVREQPHGH